MNDVNPAPANDARPRTAPAFSWFALVLSLAVLAVAVVGVIARGPQTADAVVYAYTFEEGQTRTYDFSMRMQFSTEGVPGMPQVPELPAGTVSGTMAVKALDVRPDRSSVVELTFSDMKASFPGAPTDEGSGDGTMKMTLAPSGEVLKVEGTSGVFGTFDPTQFFGLPSGSTGSALGSASLFPAFPDKAIATGDTWMESQDVPLPFGDGSFKVTTNGRHDGFEDTAYGRAARMHLRTTMPFDFDFSFTDLLAAIGQAARPEGMPAGFDLGRMVIKGSATGDTTALVPPNGGDLVKMITDMDMDFDITMDMAKLVPGASADDMPGNFGIAMTMRMEMSRRS